MSEDAPKTDTIEDEAPSTDDSETPGSQMVWVGDKKVQLLHKRGDTARIRRESGEVEEVPIKDIIWFGFIATSGAVRPMDAPPAREPGAVVTSGIEESDDGEVLAIRIPSPKLEEVLKRPEVRAAIKQIVGFLEERQRRASTEENLKLEALKKATQEGNLFEAVPIEDESGRKAESSISVVDYLGDTLREVAADVTELYREVEEVGNERMRPLLNNTYRLYSSLRDLLERLEDISALPEAPPPPGAEELAEEGEALEPGTIEEVIEGDEKDPEIRRLDAKIKELEEKRGKLSLWEKVKKAVDARWEKLYEADTHKEHRRNKNKRRAIYLGAAAVQAALLLTNMAGPEVILAAGSFTALRGPHTVRSMKRKVWERRQNRAQEDREDRQKEIQKEKEKKLKREAAESS